MPTPDEPCRWHRQRELQQVRSTTAVGLLVGCVLMWHAAPSLAQVNGAQVKRAIARGVRSLKVQQRMDGTWPERHHTGGETCLAALALLQAGESPDSRVLSSALAHIQKLRHQKVYVVSLKIMVLAQAGSTKYRREIESAARWLLSAQNESGLWTYARGGDTFDHSNAQFAMLGLHAAAQAGVEIRAGVWRIARRRVLSTQNRDGGWCYTRGGRSYGSMTAAGVSDLLIAGYREIAGREKGFRNGVAPGCGRYQTNKPLAAGLDWLGRRFRPDNNPNGAPSFLYYWLYAVERCGILSGRRYLGRHDWYREGAEFLVRKQSRTGTWGGSLSSTCFALLFLSKGHKPLLVQKLRWSENNDWNLDRYDLEHLVSFIDDKLGEPVAWQTVDFNSPLEDWLAAPILYVQGHAFPKWGPAERGKLRAYVERGGTIFAEACCGRAEFRRGFRTFAAETFPNHPLRKLGAAHSLYGAIYKLEAGTLEGIDVGCRTSVLFSPDDLSCLWEQAGVPALSLQAFKLGANIAAYATGRQALRDRLDVIATPDATRADDVSDGPPHLDALRLAQVVYAGDWRPDPLALVNFVEFLRDELELNVVSRYGVVRLTEAELANAPILYLTGHYAFSFSVKERAALAAHLRRGGFLFAEACCGREEFDRSFQTVMRQAFPELDLAPLPPDHPIHRGRPGFDVSTVRYRRALAAEQPALNTPRLMGLTIDERLAVVYSRYGVGCGLDGHECHDCRGLETPDARRLTANVILYALTH